MDASKLFIIPTPIGNLGDITFRAVEVMKRCEVLLAEDTRQTGKLLKHYAIQTKMQAFHLNNEHRIVESIVAKLRAGAVLGLCSDAGTPGISDPGFLLIRECIKNDISVEVLPGATALIPALVASGLPCDKFVFEGFLPHKKGKQTLIQSWITEERSLIFYESPYRILKTLLLIKEILGPQRRLSVARELTKIYEEHLRGTAEELVDHFSEHQPKGEFVIIVGGKSIE